jgi:hypothetical protein
VLAPVGGPGSDPDGVVGVEVREQTLSSVKALVYIWCRVLFPTTEQGFANDGEWQYKEILDHETI